MVGGQRILVVSCSKNATRMIYLNFLFNSRVPNYILIFYLACIILNALEFGMLEPNTFSPLPIDVAQNVLIDSNTTNVHEHH